MPPPPMLPGMPGPPRMPGMPGMPAPGFSMIAQPTKPKLSLKKKLKPLHWQKILLFPKGHPKYKHLIWEHVKEHKFDQTQLEDLFEAKVIQL
jgi:hypothetical protein